MTSPEERESSIQRNLKSFGMVDFVAGLTTLAHPYADVAMTSQVDAILGAIEHRTECRGQALLSHLIAHERVILSEVTRAKTELLGLSLAFSAHTVAHNGFEGHVCEGLFHRMAAHDLRGFMAWALATNPKGKILTTAHLDDAMRNIEGVLKGAFGNTDMKAYFFGTYQEEASRIFSDENGFLSNPNDGNLAHTHAPLMRSLWEFGWKIMHEAKHTGFTINY